MIRIGDKPVIAFKGDHEPVHMTKGNTKVTGWRRELLSGTELSFLNTYKDSVSLSIKGETKVSDEVYREKTGKTVVIPVSEHKKASADKVLVSGNTVQMSDWHGVDGQSSQYIETKTVGKNLLDWRNFTWKEIGGDSYAGYATVESDSVVTYYSESGSYGIYAENIINIKTNTDYVLTCSNEIISGSNPLGLRVHFLDTETYTTTTSGSLPFNSGSNTRIQIMYYINMPATSAGVVKLRDFQLELGNVATAYEPYKDTVKNGLVLEYNGKNFFNAPQTTLLKDRSGNGNHGTPSGFAYNSTSGSDGNGGIVFDGIDDGISLPRVASLDNSSDITMEVIASQDSGATASHKMCIMLRDSTYLDFSSGMPFVSMNINNSQKSFSSNTITPVNTYHHIVATYNGAVMKIYVNGVMKNSMEVTGTLKADYPSFLIGSYTDKSLSLKGKIACARIYNRALSDSEVYQNYLAGTSLNTPSPEDPSPVVSSLPAGKYKYTSTDGLYEFTLNEELRGIGDATDKVVFDRVGHQGCLERRISEIVCNGAEPWVSATSPSGNPDLRRFTLKKTDLIPNFQYNVMSDRLVANEQASFANTTSESVSTHSPNGDNAINLWIHKSRLLEDTVVGFKNWLSLNNTVFNYVKIPTRTPLTFTKVSSSTAPKVPMQFITSEVSPDYPAGLYSTEEGSVTTRGKNLFDYLDCSAPNLTHIENGYRLAGYAVGVTQVNPLSKRLKPNTAYTYTRTLTILSGIVGATGKLALRRSSDGSWLYYGSISSGTQSSTFVTPSDIGSYDALYIYGTSGDGIVEITNIQIEEGSVATPYQAYISAKSTTPLLRKVGTVADTYNPLTGEYVQRVGVKVFDGSEAWLDDFGASGNYYYYNPLGNGHNLTIPSWKCTHALFSTKTNIQNAVNTFHFTTSGSGYFEFSTYKFSSSADMKVWMAQECSNGTPITVYYHLKTQIVTYLEPNLVPLYDVDTYIESDNTIVQPDITVGYELKDGVTTNINDITEPHPEYPRAIDGVGEYDAVNDDYNLEVYSGVGRNLLRDSGSVVNRYGYPMKSYSYGSDVPKDGDVCTVTMKFSLGSDIDSLALFTSGGYNNPCTFRRSDQDSNGVVKKTFTMRYATGKHPEDGYNSVSVYPMPSTSRDPSIIEWIKLERGTVATLWTPAPEDIQYNTPTNNTFKTLHNFPIEMNRVGDIADEYTPPFWGAGYDGDGRNLIYNTVFSGKSNKYTHNNVAGEGGFRYYYDQGHMIMKPRQGEKYTISMRARGECNIGFYMISPLGNSRLSWINKAQLSTTEYRDFTLTFTPHNPELTEVYICTDWSATPFTTWFEIEPCSLKLERGSTKTPWTPSSGEFVQRVGKKVFDGTEGGSSAIATAPNGLGYQAYFQMPLDKSRQPSSAVRLTCSHFKPTGGYATRDVHIGCVSEAQNNTPIYFAWDKKLATTASEFKAWLQSQYNKGTPVTVYYILATPVLSTITGSAIPTFFPSTKVETLTVGTKPRISGTARVIDLLESDF